MTPSPDDIKLIQSRLNVAADGLWGPRTRKALFEALGIADAPPTPPGSLLSPSPACIKFIQQFEGYKRDLHDGRVQAYPDPATGGAPWTIGWGTTGPDVRKGTIWTRGQAEQRFRAHVEEFAAGVRKLIGNAPTNQHQFDALVSFAYNLGEGNLAGSTLLKLHKAGDYAGAAGQFSKWVKAAGRVLPGLLRRRAAEAAMYRGGP
jgi:lysozyme